MKEILLKLITVIHICFIIFMVVTPFFNSNYFLLLHTIFIPFLIFHWICNDNTCVLTVIEKKLRKEISGEVDENDCITCRLIEPVYDFRKNYQGFTMIIYTITILLFLLSSGKLVYRYSTGEIKGLKDLFII